MPASSAGIGSWVVTSGPVMTSPIEDLVAALLGVDGDVVRHRLGIGERDVELLAGRRLDGGDVEHEVVRADADLAIGDRGGAGAGTPAGAITAGAAVTPSSPLLQAARAPVMTRRRLRNAVGRAEARK